jgi:hypothetical protein
MRAINVNIDKKRHEVIRIHKKAILKNKNLFRKSVFRFFSSPSIPDTVIALKALCPEPDLLPVL